jgi:hypothetical protein
MPRTVIVRGWGGEPLRRVAVSEGKGVVFISSERAADGRTDDFPPAIGAPVEDVFAFDSVAFDRLTQIWQRDHTTAPEEWAGLRRWDYEAASIDDTDIERELNQ